MLKKLACLLALIATPIFAQQTPQAIPLTSGACKLDGTVGCGAGGGGGSGTVTSVGASGGTTGFSFGGGPITTSGTFTLSGTLAIANGGTNLTTYTLGDILYSSAANTLARLAGNTTATKKFLMQVGDGTVSAAPSWTATAADFPTLNQNTTGNAATATQLAADPGNCLSGNAPLGVSANGDAEGCFAVVQPTDIMVGDSGSGGTAGLVPAPAAGDAAKCLSGAGTYVACSGGGGGADTALSNIASVVIPVDLNTAAGVAANLKATAPAQITTAQAGIGASVKASDAVAGSSVAGAAAGGTLTLQAGDAKRLTSGNASGGGVSVNTGAGIGTGAPGGFVVFTGGPTVSNQKVRLLAPATSSLVVDSGALADAYYTGATSTIVGSSGSTSAAPSVIAVGYGASVPSTATGATVIGTSANNGTGASNETGGLSSLGGSANVVIIGRYAATTATSGQDRAIAIGYAARADAADKAVIGGITVSALQIGSTSNTPKTRVLAAASSRAGTDSNVAGSGLNVAGGLGTGTAGGGSLRLQTAPADSTGTTANTLADRRVFAAKQVTLTESTDTLVLNVGVASGSVAGGVFSYTIRADDGTDFQAIRGDVPWSAINKAGTVTVTLGTPVEVTTTSTGTLTNTTTAVVNGNAIDFKLNAVSSLTQTTLHAYVSAVQDGTGVFTTQ